MGLLSPFHAVEAWETGSASFAPVDHAPNWKISYILVPHERGYTTSLAGLVRHTSSVP